MSLSIVLPCIIAFVIAAAMGPFLIPFLHRLKVGQTEREELKSHQVKAGTPTMGGIMILVAVLITGCIFAVKYPTIIPVMILMVGFGIIGFIDDFLKVVLRRSDGLIAWQKLLLQILFTTIFLVYLHFFTEISLELLVPFSGGYYLNLGWVAYPLAYFAIIGTVNGVNFTDGVDGLATTVTLVVAAFFVVAAELLGIGITPIVAATIGALLAFLYFNAYPAAVFMGDTGSLALGGFVAACAYMLQLPLFILIVGFIYLIEVISVILQVVYFKKTHGKRIFRMAPIHHHFELGGWSETQVVARFAILTALLCLVGLAALVI